MPVNSKKQGQGQTGKKGDDAKTQAKKNSTVTKDVVPKEKSKR